MELWDLPMSLGATVKVEAMIKILKCVTSQATGHCTLSRVFVFKGIHILYNITTPSLLNGCLPWHQWGNSKSLFAYHFPVSDFLLLIKLITRIPHPYCISVSNCSFFSPSCVCHSCSIHCKWKRLQFPLNSVYNVKHPPGIFTTANYSHNHLRRFDNRADWLILKSTGEVTLKTGYRYRQQPDVQPKYLCWQMWW